MGQTVSFKSMNPMENIKTKTSDEIGVDYDVISPRFSVSNTEEVQQGIDHLNEHGYAVFSNVLSKDDIDRSVDLFWKHMENLRESNPIRRDDHQTWEKGWPGAPRVGLLNDKGIGQSEFMWSVRGNPNIKEVFSHIWNSNELFVSFDGAGCFRDWHLNKEWKTSGNWYHCDQNPFAKPDRCSIQGLVSLTDSDEFTGGLVVVPDSHKHFLELQSTLRNRDGATNYVRIPYQYPLLEKLHPRLIKCKAGDLIVWDSRCIHCNTPALNQEQQATISTGSPRLLRIVAYICMSPASMFVCKTGEYKNLEEFREKREECVRQRVTCTHWPLELIPASYGMHNPNTHLKFNAYQHSLINGTNVEYVDGPSDIEF